LKIDLGKTPDHRRDHLGRHKQVDGKSVGDTFRIEAADRAPGSPKLSNWSAQQNKSELQQALILQIRERKEQLAAANS
jgi:hypothetical protein